MYEISVIGGFLVLAFIANIIFSSDDEFEKDAERKSNSKSYKDF